VPKERPPSTRLRACSNWWASRRVAACCAAPRHPTACVRRCVCDILQALALPVAPRAALPASPLKALAHAVEELGAHFRCPVWYDRAPLAHAYPRCVGGCGAAAQRCRVVPLPLCATETAHVQRVSHAKPPCCRGVLGCAGASAIFAVSTHCGAPCRCGVWGAPHVPSSVGESLLSLSRCAWRQLEPVQRREHHSVRPHVLPRVHCERNGVAAPLSGVQGGVLEAPAEGQRADVSLRRPLPTPPQE
jgi:hypothetical protein